MKCTECGTTMKTQRENYRYDESGLKEVTLVGIEVSRCPRCGNYEVSIPHMEDLHRLIARAVIEKTTRLTSEEVRFLRKSLGWSGVDFEGGGPPAAQPCRAGRTVRSRLGRRRTASFVSWSPRVD